MPSLLKRPALEKLFAEFMNPDFGIIVIRSYRHNPPRVTPFRAVKPNNHVLFIVISSIEWIKVP